jgi:hypothetical protein
MQNTATIEMNNVNQNANAQIVGNALQAFKARFNLQERARKSATKNVLPLNSLENGCQHLLNRVEAIRANSTSDEFKNTNLISLEDGIYTTSLYLGKAVIYLDGEQLNGEFDNAEEAVSMIEDYVALVKSGEEQFVQSMTKALAKISTYSIKDRSTKGHK